MVKDGLAWECDCGHLELAQNPPQECPECSAVASFESVPEELIADKQEAHILSLKENGDEND
jgi:hypothetical protein